MEYISYGALMNPAEIIRGAVRKRLRQDSLGARRFEELNGLRRNSLHGILRKSQPKVPSVNLAAEICSALGLEFYIGPPKDRDTEIPRDVLRAIKEVVHNRDQQILMQAMQAVENTIRRFRDLAAEPEQTQRARRDSLTPMERIMEDVIAVHQALEKIQEEEGWQTSDMILEASQKAVEIIDCLERAAKHKQ